jgi:lipid-A-disaccharide synthase
MLGALPFIRQAHPGIRARMIVPDPSLARLAAQIAGAPASPDVATILPQDVELRVGQLAESLAEADLAIASTGTVTMECAYFGVPTVAMYKTSWSTYQIGKRIISVPFLAMPNLLAGRRLFPELIQQDATPERIARETLALLDQPDRRRDIRKGLRDVIDSLGPPGAIARAAQAIESLLVR